MAYELEELYELTARRLKIIEISEPLSADDRQRIATLWPGVYGMLEGRQLAVFSSAGPIDDRFALPLRDLLAEQAAGEFGKDFVAPWALPEMYRQAKPMYTYDETPFFDF